jgi:heme oxygenase
MPLLASNATSSAADKRPCQFAVVILTANNMSEAFIKAGRGVGARPTRDVTRKVNRVIGVVHRALRVATRDYHASIDRMLLAFNLSSAKDYQAFLSIHFDTLLALREKWRVEDNADFGQMLSCLDSDLKSLGTEVTLPSIAASGNAVNADQALGIAYVIRGSRLGTIVLRQNVGCTLSSSYMDFAPTLSWTEFLLQLESIAGDRSRIEEASRAACNAFASFATKFMRANRVIVRPPP